MKLSLSETQKRYWTQLGELLRPLNGEGGLSEKSSHLKRQGEAVFATLQLFLAEPEPLQAPTVVEKVVEAPQIAITPAPAAAPTFQEPLPFIPVATAPELEADTRSQAEIIAAARAAFSLEAVAHIPVRDFFSLIGYGRKGKSASLVHVIEPLRVEVSQLGAREFFTTRVPWAGRGTLPAVAEVPSATAPLRSLLAAATESALHAARRVARREAARQGSAAAFFQSLSWQRNAAAQEIEPIAA